MLKFTAAMVHYHFYSHWNYVRGYYELVQEGNLVLYLMLKIQRHAKKKTNKKNTPGEIAWTNSIHVTHTETYIHWYANLCLMLVFSSRHSTTAPISLCLIYLSTRSLTAFLLTLLLVNVSTCHCVVLNRKDVRVGEHIFCFVLFFSRRIGRWGKCNFTINTDKAAAYWKRIKEQNANKI